MFEKLILPVVIAQLAVMAPSWAGASITCPLRSEDAKPSYLACLQSEDARFKERAKHYTELGNQYEYGEGVERDFKQAAAYYRLGCAKANGNACVYLARMYKNGSGVPKSPLRARRLLHRALILD